MAKKNRSRKKRRQERAVLKHGTAAKPTHKAPSGRTGHVRAKRLIGAQGSRRKAGEGKREPGEVYRVRYFRDPETGRMVRES